MTVYELPYLWLLLAAPIIAYIAGMIPRLETPIARYLVVVPYGVLTAILISFIAMRDISVGTDTPTMSRIFQNTPFDTLENAFATRQQEYGYVTLMHYLRRYTENPRWLLIVMSVLTVGIVLAVLWRRSPYFGLSVFLYLALGDYLFPISGMRQGLAIALVFAAWALARRRVLSVVLLVIAVLFHTTALAALLVVLLLPRLRPNKTWLTAVLVGTGASILLAASLHYFDWLALLNERYAWYVRDQFAGGIGSWVMLAFYLALVLWSYQYARTADRNIQSAWLMFSVSPVFLAFGTQITDMRRIALYFTIFGAIAFAAFLREAVSPGARIVFGAAAIVYYVRYLHIDFGLIPYTRGSDLVTGELQFIFTAAILVPLLLLVVTSTKRTPQLAVVADVPVEVDEVTDEVDEVVEETEEPESISDSLSVGDFELDSALSPSSEIADRDSRLVAVTPGAVAAETLHGSDVNRMPPSFLPAATSVAR